MSGETDARGMISVKQAATLLGVTPRWIRQLSADGFLPSPVDGSLPLVGAIQGYIKWLKDDERRAARMSAQTRVQSARAREIELRIARMEQGLIPVEDVERDFLDIMNVHREEQAIVSAETSDPTVRAEVEARINDAIERAERRFRKAMNALGAVKTRTRKVIHNGW
jgi:hypothetical protein